MKREERARIARETVDLVRSAALAPLVEPCVKATLHLSAEETERMRAAGPSISFERDALVEVTNETTIAAILRLRNEPRLAALNFASARNPGGGFLGGSQAQEESLARSSALYESQIAVMEFYERHRAMRTLLYSDAMIVSPRCPVLRDDGGVLLDEPVLVDFITSPAPNTGAIAQNQPEHLPLVDATLVRRSEQILAVAAHIGCRALILGAWGCGVFRNDPALVASAFTEGLRKWRRSFERIVFAVFDTTPDTGVLRTFERVVAEL